MLATPARDVAPASHSREESRELVHIPRWAGGARGVGSVRDADEHDGERAAGPTRAGDLPPELDFVPAAVGDAGLGIEEEPRLDVREPTGIGESRRDLREQVVQDRGVLGPEGVRGRGVGHERSRNSGGRPERRDERRVEHRVVRLSRGAVRPVDRRGAERPCVERRQRSLGEVACRLRAGRRNDRPASGALHPEHDGVRARPRGCLGHDVVEERVEVERQRLQPCRLRHGDAFDRLLHVGRDRVEMARESLDHGLETSLGSVARPAHGVHRQPAGHEHSARRNDPDHHRSSRSSRPAHCMREKGAFLRGVCYDPAAGWRGVACPPALSL